jgi:hypothetical protein
MATNDTIYKKCVCSICWATTPTRKAMCRHLEEEHNIKRHKKRYYDIVDTSSKPEDTIDDFLKGLKE